MISIMIEKQLPVVRHSNGSRPVQAGKGYHIQLEREDFRFRGGDDRASPQGNKLTMPALVSLALLCTPWYISNVCSFNMVFSGLLRS